MAWLREAAAASAQRSAGTTAPAAVAVSAGSSAPSWSRIDDLGGGLFLCGAAALENRVELERLGIRSILNCATEDLYDRSYSQKENSAPLRQKLEAIPQPSLLQPPALPSEASLPVTVAGLQGASLRRPRCRRAANDRSLEATGSEPVKDIAAAHHGCLQTPPLF